MKPRKEKINYYTALRRRLRCKQRAYNSLRLTRQSRPVYLSCLIVGITLIFFYYNVTTEAAIVRSDDLIGPLQTREENSTADDRNRLTLITFNNMTFVVNITQDFISLLQNISKQIFNESIVVHNLDNANFTEIPGVVANSIIEEYNRKKRKRKRRKGTLPLNYVNITDLANLHRLRKSKRYKINIASAYNMQTISNRTLENNSPSVRVLTGLNLF